MVIKGEGRGNKFNNSIPHVHHRDVKNISSSGNKRPKRQWFWYTHTTNRLTGVSTINCLEFNPVVTLSGRFPSGRLQMSLGITTCIVRCLGTPPKHLHSSPRHPRVVFDSSKSLSFPASWQNKACLLAHMYHMLVTYSGLWKGRLLLHGRVFQLLLRVYRQDKFWF